MNSVGAALERIVARLDAGQAQWAVVGGLAVSARCEPRFTRDVDVCVLAVDDDHAQQVVRSLVVAGYAVDGLVEQEAADRLATVRLLEPGAVTAGVVVDLLFASSGIEPEVVRAAERLEVLPGLHVPVASAGHLVVLKLLARDDERRPQDAGDLRSLLPVLTDQDREEATAAAALVVSRGFARDRDLVSLLRDYLS